MDAIKEARLSRQVDALLSRIEALEAGEQELVAAHDALVDQLREVNFRVVYALQYFQFGKEVKTGLLDSFGKEETRIEKLTLWDLYHLNREQFITKIEAENAAAAAALEDAAASATQPSDDTSGSGAAPAAETLPERAPDKPGTIVQGDFSVKH